LKEKSHKTKVAPARNVLACNSHLWTFQHKKILSATESDRYWDQKKLVNKLNYLNFIDGYVFIILNHSETDEYFLIKAYPQPCIKDELLCRLDSQDNFLDPTKYSLDYLMIDDGLNAILAPVQLFSAEGNALKLKLPDKSIIIATRKTKRYYCENITSEIIQGSFNARGTLIDFTPSGLGIKTTGNENMKGFDENNSALINLTSNGDKLFSGLCRCIRKDINATDSRIIFSPINTQMALFPKREVRNSREQLAPSFTVNFKHPLFQKHAIRDVFDISTSGFSIQDSLEEEILIPGMIIPKISIVYAGVIKMNCSAQVVYRQEDQQSKIIKCGLAIADMDVKSCTYLNHILGTYLDGYARFSTEVDMEALWEFFFDTGFIYGEKYEHLYFYRENFKETYQKLYQDKPDIAQHFVYEKNGKIYGHIAMLHAYEPSWIIHHFAARKMGNRLPGNAVLKQINQFIRSYNRLPSSGMDHVMTYYQPNNKVVDRIFGRFTRQLNDHKKSSLDSFSYFPFKKKLLFQNKLDNNLVLRETNSSDLFKLKEFYESSSGGLLLSSLGLDTSSDSIKKSFSRAGFKRDYKSFCLCYKEKQIAIFIVNQSDLGLNLSDLLNCIMVIVLDKNDLPWTALSAAVNNLSGVFIEEIIPLLIFPSNYLSSQNINEEKQYILWILHTYNAVEEYLSYINNLLKLKSGNQ